MELNSLGSIDIKWGGGREGGEGGGGGRGGGGGKSKNLIRIYSLDYLEQIQAITLIYIYKEFCPN